MAKIIIVDDMLNSRAMLRDYMNIAGHQTIADFEDGIVALEFIKEVQPDIVLLDYNLNTFHNGNKYDGISLLKDIKKLYPAIKIMIISAFAEPEVIKKAMLSGADDFIVKPFKGDDLISRINKLAKK